MKLLIVLLLISTKCFSQTSTKASVLVLKPPLNGEQKGNNYDSATFSFQYREDHFKVENGKFALVNPGGTGTGDIIRIRDTVYIYTGESHPKRQSATAKEAGDFIIPFDATDGIPDDYDYYQVYKHSSTGTVRKLLIPETEYKKINGVLVVFKVKKNEKVVYWRLK